MNTMLKPVTLGVWFVAMLCAADAPEAPFTLGFVREAEAGIFFAPVRRTVVAVAAVSAVTASSSANAAAAANANAAAANANAAAAKAGAAQAPPPAGPMPVGTIVTTLPAGCVPDKLNGVDYMRCGSSYYKTQMMGSNLVFVVAQP